MGKFFLYLFFATAGASRLAVADSSVRQSIIPLGMFNLWLYCIHGAILWWATDKNDVPKKACGAPQRMLVASSAATKGFVKITGHLVFDVKLGENFRRKARFCADGHKLATPASITYSSVVSRDSVRILLMIAALNELELRAADIQNAFLTAPNL
jgi:hypothetical protein